MKNVTFRPTLTRSEIPIKKYIASRIVSPIAIVQAIKHPIGNVRCIGNVLFTARYNSGKAIEGYDFV